MHEFKPRKSADFVIDVPAIIIASTVLWQVLQRGGACSGAPVLVLDSDRASMTLQHSLCWVVGRTRNLSWRLRAVLLACLALLILIFQLACLLWLVAVALDRFVCDWDFLIFFLFLDSLKGHFLKLTINEAIVEASSLEARRALS